MTLIINALILKTDKGTFTFRKQFVDGQRGDT